MQIKRNGVVFTNAYAFMEPSKWPKNHVNGCTLLWRFLWFGFWRVVTNIIWIAFLLISTVLLLMRAFGEFLLGRRLVFFKHLPEKDLPPTEWKWLNDLEPMYRLFLVTHYTPMDIYNMPRIGGIRILPVWVLYILVVGYLEILMWVYAFPILMNTPLDFESKEVSGALLISIGHLAVFLIVLFVPLLSQLKRVRRSEIGQLIGAQWQAFKDRTCPVVEIV